MREECLRLQAFVRNQELSRDVEHIRRHSPLRPGMCLELVGDEDHYSCDDRPGWLRGRECRRATFLRFERLGENLAPVALVEFDEEIDMPGHKGRYGILFARYGCDYAAWALPKGSIALCIIEALPNVGDFCDCHTFTERHACYRVKETPDEPDWSNG